MELEEEEGQDRRRRGRTGRDGAGRGGAGRGGTGQDGAGQDISRVTEPLSGGEAAALLLLCCCSAALLLCPCSAAASHDRHRHLPWQEDGFSCLRNRKRKKKTAAAAAVTFSQWRGLDWRADKAAHLRLFRCGGELTKAGPPSQALASRASEKSAKQQPQLPLYLTDTTRFRVDI